MSWRLEYSKKDRDTWRTLSENEGTGNGKISDVRLDPIETVEQAYQYATYFNNTYADWRLRLTNLSTNQVVWSVDSTLPGSVLPPLTFSLRRARPRRYRVLR